MSKPTDAHVNLYLLKNEIKIHRRLLNNFTDDVHRPALPYKFKFKVSGCPNDCVNSIERADFAIIGTWKDDMKVDQEEVKDFVEKKGRKYVIDNVNLAQLTPP